MKVKQIAISTFADLMLGGRLWKDVRHLVSSIETNTKLTGNEKRASVYADLKLIFEDISAVVLNLAIELATLWLRGVVV